MINNIYSSAIIKFIINNPFKVCFINESYIFLPDLMFLAVSKKRLLSGLIVGAFGFLISGSYLNAQLPLSVGFLNIPAFLIFFPITAFMARLGAKASHRIDKKKMTRYFGLFLVVIGTRFLYEYFSL